MREREVYGVLVPGPRPEVLVAGANGRAASTSVQGALTALAGPGATPRVRDLVARRPADPQGVALQQVVLAVILGAFLFAVLTAQIALGERLGTRLAAAALFAALLGASATLLADPVLGVLTGAPLVLAGLVTWTALTIALGVQALARGLGQLGVALGLLLFLVVGNPAAAANAPTEWLPGFFRAVGPWLPPNAGATAIVGALSFDDDLLRPLLVLAGWTLVPLVVLGVLESRRGSREPLAVAAAAVARPAAERASVPAGGLARQ